MVVLEAECLPVDFVENRQCHVQVLHAAFHVLYAWVNFWVYNFELLVVFFDISLLHSILISYVLCEVIRYGFER